jgi:hypothetical protein
MILRVNPSGGSRNCQYLVENFRKCPYRQKSIRPVSCARAATLNWIGKFRARARAELEERNLG